MQLLVVSTCWYKSSWLGYLKKKRLEKLCQSLLKKKNQNKQTNKAMVEKMCTKQALGFLGLIYNEMHGS